MQQLHNSCTTFTQPFCNSCTTLRNLCLYRWTFILHHIGWKLKETYAHSLRVLRQTIGLKKFNFSQEHWAPFYSAIIVQNYTTSWEHGYTTVAQHLPSRSATVVQRLENCVLKDECLYYTILAKNSKIYTHLLWVPRLLRTLKLTCHFSRTFNGWDPKKHLPPLQKQDLDSSGKKDLNGFDSNYNLLPLTNYSRVPIAS